MRIRVSALFEREEQILCMKYIYGGKEIFALPGGGVDKDVPLQEAIVAEWRTEIGVKLDDFVKSRKCPRIVIPVKTGSQRFQRVTKTLDTGFHRCDDFLRERQARNRGYHHDRRGACNQDASPDPAHRIRRPRNPWHTKDQAGQHPLPRYRLGPGGKSA